MRFHEENDTIMVDFGPGLFGWFERRDLELAYRPPALRLRLAGPTPAPPEPESWLPAREPRTRLTPPRVAGIDPEVRKLPRMCRDFVRGHACTRPDCRFEHAHTVANELIEPLQWEDGQVMPGKFKVVFHVISEAHGVPKYRGPKVTPLRPEASVTCRVDSRDDGSAAARSDGAAAGAAAASETEGTVGPAYHFFLGSGPMSFHDSEGPKGVNRWQTGNLRSVHEGRVLTAGEHGGPPDPEQQSGALSEGARAGNPRSREAGL